MDVHVAKLEGTGKWQLSVSSDTRLRQIDLGRTPSAIDAAEALAAQHLPFNPEWERHATCKTYSTATNVPENFRVSDVEVNP